METLSEIASRINLRGPSLEPRNYSPARSPAATTYSRGYSDCDCSDCSDCNCDCSGGDCDCTSPECEN